MFDEGARITLFGIAAAAFILTMAQEQNAPRAAPATSVDAARFPALPFTARPDGSPAQTDIAAMRVPLAEGFEAELLHGYVLEGRVVTRREFRNDATSAISPLDLGIVWGRLAEPGRAEAISFRAVIRGVRYRAPPEVLFDGWEEQVTNNHLIPADAEVHAALMAVEVGQRVRLRGYLVEVTGNGIAAWRSSTRRDDSSIIGGCEIILVTGVEVLPEDGKDA
ncbi:hypothetical protein [Roseicyclus sp.]|uniref:hypothetical protein n=1 Tax=Roseicyclus sp. TaxID=1914329 RepID=UPI003F9FFE9B